VEQADHRTGRLADDPLDEPEGAIRAQAEADERDVGSLPSGHCADIFDLDLARDHLVAERRNDRATSASRPLRSLAISTRRCSVSR